MKLSNNNYHIVKGIFRWADDSDLKALSDFLNMEIKKREIKELAANYEANLIW